MNFNITSNIDEIILEYHKPFRFKKSVLSEITELMRLDIQQNLESGRSFDGSIIAPKKSGGRIFYETGLLLNSVNKNISTDAGEVFINGSRSEIAAILQYGSSKNNLPSRPFFGISERISSGISDYLNNKTLTDLLEI